MKNIVAYHPVVSFGDVFVELSLDDWYCDEEVLGFVIANGLVGESDTGPFLDQVRLGAFEWARVVDASRSDGAIKFN